MKKVVASVLVIAFLLSGCSGSVSTDQSGGDTVSVSPEPTPTIFSNIVGGPDDDPFNLDLIELDKFAATFDDVEYENLNDDNLQRLIHDTVYDELANQFEGQDFFIEDITTQYISQEYIEELAYNSKLNVYFGYSLAELDSQFSGTRYIFTLGENGETDVIPFAGYDKTYEQVIQNVAVGTGVILVCATVSMATGGAAPAVSVIFAASAKSGSIMALSSGAIGSIIGGTVEGIQSKDFDKAIKAAALAGSEGFKWGAISGAITGGATEAVLLKDATTGGLTMNQAASIQRESKYPLDVIKQFKSMEQYEICRDAGLQPVMIDGKTALVRPINWKQLDADGNSNVSRVIRGLSPLDENGIPYELHHIGQNADSTLAVLTKYEHMQGGNNTIWHEFTQSAVDHGSAWATQKHRFWVRVAKQQLTPPI